MMASRGMGAISPSKMPRGKKIERKDDPNTVDMYKRGGKVKKYNGEEESLVKKSKRDLSGEGEGFKPSAEELATGKFKQRAVDVGQMQEGAKFFPGFAQLSKDSQTVGGRGSYTKKLDKDTALEAYADMYLHKDRGGVKGGAPSYGARITHSFAGGGLYDNIHAKQQRIAEGSGEKMRKVGAKGAPTKADFVKSAKTARKK
jgi:hypothetical protein